MTRGEFLARAIKQKGTNVNRLSAETGISYSTIKSMIERDLKNASIDNVIKICDTLGVSVEDLVRVGVPDNLTHAGGREAMIPVIGEISCGDPITAVENIEGYIAEPASRLPSGILFYLRAKGDSMAPTIENGALVLIREQDDVENGEVAAVLVNGGTEATLKRVKKDNGTLLLIPDNRNYPPIIATNENPVRVIGKAIRVTREL